MDWEYYIDNDLSNSIVRSTSFFILFKIYYNKYHLQYKPNKFLLYMEKVLWNPRNCLINMKTNMRYFYSIYITVVGMTAIKNTYFYISKTKDLDLNMKDFLTVGALSGAFFSIQVVSFNLKNILKFSLMGGILGMYYNAMICYFVNRRKLKARKIGIKL